MKFRDEIEELRAVHSQYQRVGHLDPDRKGAIVDQDGGVVELGGASPFTAPPAAGHRVAGPRPQSLAPDDPTSISPEEAKANAREEARARKQRKALEDGVLSEVKGLREAYQFKFSDAFKRKELGDFVPYVSGAKEAYDLAVVYGAARRADLGTPREGDEEIIQEYGRKVLEESQRGGGFGYQVGSLIAGSVPFVGEFLTGGALYSGASYASKKALGKAVKEAVEEKVQRTLLGRVGDAIGAAATQTLAGEAIPHLLGPNGGRVSASAFRRALPELQLSESEAGELVVFLEGTSEDFFKALPKGVVDQFIENLSEHAGSFLPSMRALQGKIVGEQIASGKTYRQVMEAIRKSGWHGPLGEYFEERVGDAARATGGGVGLEEQATDSVADYWDAIWPDLEQSAVELASFSMMQGAVTGTAALAQGITGSPAPSEPSGDGESSSLPGAAPPTPEKKSEEVGRQDSPLPAQEGGSVHTPDPGAPAGAQAPEGGLGVGAQPGAQASEAARPEEELGAGAPRPEAPGEGGTPQEGAQDGARQPAGAPLAEQGGRKLVVGEEGQPLTVYHGTDQSFEEYDPEAESIFDYGEAGRSGGISFSESAEVAGYHAGEGPGANIRPAYLYANNPKVIDKGSLGPGLAAQSKAVQEAREQGHDAVKIEGTGEWIVFEPGQIVSATATDGQAPPTADTAPPSPEVRALREQNQDQGIRPVEDYSDPDVEALAAHGGIQVEYVESGTGEALPFSGVSLRPGHIAVDVNAEEPVRLAAHEILVHDTARRLGLSEWAPFVQRAFEADPEGAQAAVKRHRDEWIQSQVKAGAAPEAAAQAYDALPADERLEEAAATQAEDLAYLVRGWLEGAESEATLAKVLQKDRSLGETILDALVALLKRVGVQVADSMERRILAVRKALRRSGAPESQQVTPATVRAARALRDLYRQAAAAEPGSAAQAAPAPRFSPSSEESKEAEAAESPKTPVEEALLSEPVAPYREGKGKAGFLRRSVLGSLPKVGRDLNLRRKGFVAQHEAMSRQLMRDFRKAVRKQYKSWAKFEASSDYAVFNQVLQGEGDGSTLPKSIQESARAWRDHIDALSQALIDSGVVEGELRATVEANRGIYLNRSYQRFDIPEKWAEKLERDYPGVLNRFKAQVRSAHPGWPEDRVKGFVMQILKGDPKDAFSLLGYDPGFPPSVETRDRSILKQRKNLTPLYRALLGEYTDPRVNYLRSTAKIANLLASHRMIEQFREEAMGTLVFREPTSNENGDFVHRIQADASQVLYPLSDEYEGGHSSPLYTTKEIAEAFDELGKAQERSTAYRMYMALNAYAKLGKTVFSPPTQVRNFLSNVWMGFANWHWRITAMGPAARAVYADVFKDGSSSERINELIQDGYKYGLMDQSVSAGELQDTLKDAQRAGGPVEWLEGSAAKFVRMPFRPLLKLYRTSDDLFKMYGWLNEQARYRKAHPEWSEEKLKRYTADIVRDTAYPTYSEVPEPIRKLRAFPMLASFVSFQSEIVRQRVNVARLVKKELSDPATWAMGVQRGVAQLLGLTAAAALSYATKRWLEMSDDDDENARYFVPWWSENSQLFWLPYAEDGSAQYVDLSYVDPFSFVTTPLLEFTRKPLDEAAIDALGDTLQPFLSDEILFGAIEDIRRGRSRWGTPIYTEDDTAEEKLKKSAAHLIKELRPGVARSVERFQKARSGHIERYGRTYDVRNEIIANVLGQRIEKIDVEQGLLSRGKAYIRSIRNASSELNTVLKDPNPVTEEQIKEAFESAMVIRERAFDDILKVTAAARALQTPEGVIKKGLERGGVGADRTGRLLRGVEVPYEVSSSTEKALDQLVEDGAISRAERDRRLRYVDRLRSEARR